jgi:hypothetical protein
MLIFIQVIYQVSQLIGGVFTMNSWGHALAPVEQQQMEYTHLNYFFGDVKQLPPASCLEESDYSQNPQYQELNVRFVKKVL